jgi:hypothetical protein
MTPYDRDPYRFVDQKIPSENRRERSLHADMPQDLFESKLISYKPDGARIVQTA